MSDDVPFLNDMSLGDLDGLAGVIMRLMDAGHAVNGGGLTPRFSLVPGLRATMVIDFTMPEVFRLEAEVDASVADDLSEHPAPVAQEAGAGSGGEGLAVALPAEPVAAGVIDALLAEPVAAKPLPAIALVDNAPEQPAATPAPGSASALAADRPASWTKEEDQRAVEIYAAAISAGAKIGEAQRQVSDALVRPFEGTRWRLTNKLAAQIAAEVLRLKGFPDVVSEVAAPAPEAPEPHVPMQPVGANPLTLHLMSLPEKGGWSLEKDFHLLRLSVEHGWPIADIALDLGMDSKATKERWDMLTGLTEDAKTGAKTRQFKARDLLDAAQRLVEAA